MLLIRILFDSCLPMNDSSINEVKGKIDAKKGARKKIILSAIFFLDSYLHFLSFVTVFEL